MADTDQRARDDEHVSEEDCVDFARRAAAAGTAPARHLDSGCRRCAEAVRLWSAVSRFAAEEASYQPPPEALRQARDHFAFQRPARLLERVARAATLVFDSFRQPLPAGVRAAGPSPRQMLFRAGRYIVRLRLEPHAGSERTSIVGQILDDQDPALALHDVAVLALKGRKTLDRTLTNEFGEFLLEPEDVESLQLSVALPRIGTFVVRPPGRRQKTARGRGARALDAAGRKRKARPR